MMRRPPRSTLSSSSAASDVYKRQATASGPDGPEAVAAAVARQVRELNAAELAGGGRLGSLGLVVGATAGPTVRDLGIALAAVRGPLLAPGVGAQGAGPAADHGPPPV